MLGLEKIQCLIKSLMISSIFTLGGRKLSEGDTSDKILTFETNHWLPSLYILFEKGNGG